MENITFDTLKEDEGTYQNHHGGLVTMMMRRKQLSDVFRKIHGNTARAYTLENPQQLEQDWTEYTHMTKIAK